jgi:hypothetical protein
MIRVFSGIPMARTQLDLFSEPEPDLFDPDWKPMSYQPDPAAVRAELQAILAQARAARVLPWDSRRARLYKTIFPQMTLWLPDEEAAQLRFDFEAELKRLEAA